jgi:putative transposase
MTMLINNSKTFDKSINHKRIYRLMKKNNMLSQYRQRSPYKGIASVTSEHQYCANLVNGNLDSPYAYNILCTDITYLICNGMRAYLSAIKDAITGRLLAYELSESFKIDFVLDTMKKLGKILLNDETMMQTDQWSHYTSPQFGNLLNELEITHSMSRREKCTDNAPIESFFGHFKYEVAYEDCKNLEELKSIVDEYMLYCNY